MNFKLIGALCVITSCSCCGFMMASEHIGRIRLLQNLISALDYMECELQYRCTPLPQLCRQASEQTTGKIQKILSLMAEELESQISPNADRCMASALDRLGDMDPMMYQILTDLGKSLGKFDLEGQLQGFDSARAVCRENLSQLVLNKDNRIRSYQTLGLCAGAAVAILFV